MGSRLLLLARFISFVTKNISIVSLLAKNLTGFRFLGLPAYSPLLEQLASANYELFSGEMMEYLTGKQHRASTSMIYGPAGGGKTTSAMQAKGSFGIDCEGGMDQVEGPRTKRLNSVDDIKDACNFAAESPDFSTLVFDSATALQQMAIDSILSEDGLGKKSLADFPYGRGYELLATKWNDYLKMFTKLNGIGKNVILIAHETIQRFEDPANESYDRYVPSIHKKALPDVIAHMDAVFFLHYETHTTSRKDGGFSKEKKRGIGTGRRIVEVEETPAWLAKNRYGLNETLDLSPEIWARIGIS